MTKQKITALFPQISTALLTLLFPKESKHAAVARMDAEALRLLLKPKCIPGAGIESFFPYESETIRNLVWALKYSGNQHAAELFSEILEDVLLQECLELAHFNASVPLMIPVPLGQKRKKDRGYNQIELVSLHLAAHLGEAVEHRADLLFRTKETRPQSSLKRAERLHNVSDAFAVHNADALKNRACILLDDVVTTGSTLGAAKDALLLAGAVTVRTYALSYAGE